MNGRFCKDQVGWRVRVLAIPAMLLLLRVGPVHAQLLDDFSDGDDDGWTHFTDPPDLEGGQWDAGDHVYRLSHGALEYGCSVGSRLDLTLDPGYSNGRFSANVVRETANTNMNLILRGNVDERTGYVFQHSAQGDLFGIFRRDGDHSVLLAPQVPYEIETGVEYKMEASCVGPYLEIRMWPRGDERPEFPQVEAMDFIYATGEFGIAVGNSMLESDISATFDDVTFDAVQPAFAIEAQGTCPGLFDVLLFGAGPGNRVGVIYSVREGSAGPVPGCQGLFVDMRAPRLAAVGEADENGRFATSGEVPDSACGVVLVQGVNQTTCEKTDVILIE